MRLWYALSRHPLNAESDLTPPPSGDLPKALLYATSAGLGGSGLNTTSLQGALASWRCGFLEEAICYPVKQEEIPHQRIRTLQHHPVRFFSFLDSQDYYAVKKHYLDWQAARRLKRGEFDFFHGWSGESFQAMVQCRLSGIPSVMDIPTWHRNKGQSKPGETLSERRERQNPARWWYFEKYRTVSRQQNLAEYDLADIILMPSRKSAETFLAAGMNEAKLHYVGRGVDIQQYQPGEAPEVFRVAFVGALIERKGVHLLLEAWKKLNLSNAELVLVGSLHEEMKPYLKEFASENVKLTGSTNRVQDILKSCAAFAFPSECEGFAKATLEAAACGLPLIGTRESGDAIVHQVTGLQVEAGQVDQLAAALEYAASHRDEMAVMGRNARKMVEEQFTWDHYRLRLLNAYAKAHSMGRN